jgi:hypothetical protein
MLIFQFFDFTDWYVVVHVLVKALNNPADYDAAKLAIAIHQMCQIIAKPNTVAKAAITMPAPLFFGI